METPEQATLVMTALHKMDMGGMQVRSSAACCSSVLVLSLVLLFWSVRYLNFQPGRTGVTTVQFRQSVKHNQAWTTITRVLLFSVVIPTTLCDSEDALLYFYHHSILYLNQFVCAPSL
jgi:hypothetical protein